MYPSNANIKISYGTASNKTARFWQALLQKQSGFPALAEYDCLEKPLIK